MALCDTDLFGECIARKRGDTAPDKIFVTDPENNGVPLDVTGFSFRMSVNTEQDPDPVGPPIIGTEIAQINGTITNPTGGEVEFPWSPGDADQVPEDYFYDIEQTDTSGRILTIAKERYQFQQDVSK
ncbi:MAG: hypothetical protein KAJ55_00665 [Anaerolineales bacterium]|nr:hypothetical protein [Anaerolineales bacterium]